MKETNNHEQKKIFNHLLNARLAIPCGWYEHRQYNLYLDIHYFCFTFARPRWTLDATEKIKVTDFSKLLSEKFYLKIHRVHLDPTKWANPSCYGHLVRNIKSQGLD